jgi:hypothetical protein
MNKREILTDITFGARVAEEEAEKLGEYFVETDQWRRIFAGLVDIVYGPKGSGKSALYSLLLQRESELFDRGILVTPAENPRGATAFRELQEDPPANETEFRALWKTYFLVLIGITFRAYDISTPDAQEVIDCLMADNLLSKEFSLTQILRDVKAFVRRALTGAKQTEFTFDSATGMPAARISVEPGVESDSGLKQHLISLESLFDSADRALASANLTLWIILDRLDVAFIESSELEANALRALFRVYSDLTAYRHISLKIFLRSDIWVRITSTGFREASHIIRNLTISWEAASLLNLVVRRLLGNQLIRDIYQVNESIVLDIAKQWELFYRVFPDQVDQGTRRPKTFDWMLSRTSDGTQATAPRELIHLLTAAQNAQIRRLEMGEAGPANESLFEGQALRDALPEVSKARLELTIYAEYPELRARLEQLRNQKTHQYVESLANIWGTSRDAATSIAQELVRIGFFEELRSGPNPEYDVPFLYRAALSMVQGKA